jgi:protein gp37
MVMDIDKGKFWDRAWKLVEGCGHVSSGCDNCWSERETKMRLNHPNKAISERAKGALHLAQIPGDITRFDGRIVLREDNLDLPMKTKKPTVFAVWNDLFNEDVPDEFIHRALSHACNTKRHTYLILTKRAARMATVMAEFWRTCYRDFETGEHIPVKPPQNIWFGVSVENQQAAEERIPHLLDVPGNKFVNCEPLLGAIDLCNLDPLPHVDHADVYLALDCLRGHMKGPDDVGDELKIHAVIAGGESGPQARPCHPDWARSLRDQCAEAGVPFFWASSAESVGRG